MDSTRAVTGMTPAKITRRGLLGAAFLTGAGIALSACGKDGAASANGNASPASSPGRSGANARPTNTKSGKVIVWNTGGTYEETLRTAVWDPFTSKTGIQVESLTVTMAKVVASIQTGKPEADILIGLPTHFGDDLQKAGMLVKLDEYDYKLTELDDIIKPNFSLHGLEDYLIADDIYCHNMIYRTDVYSGRAPKTWADFWDVATFPGKRTLQDANYNRPDLEFAELAQDPDKSKIYPIDIERAFGMLQKIKPSILKWWTSPALAMQLITSKSVQMGSCSNTRAQPLIDEGAPLKLVWNGSGREYGMSAVINGGNSDTAFQYLDYSLSPDVQARFGKAYAGIGITNKKGQAMLPAEVSQKKPTDPDNFEAGFDVDEFWWADHQKEVTERWQSFTIN